MHSVLLQSNQCTLTSCAVCRDMLTCRYNNLDELYHSKSEEGLSRLLAFLREEEERERLEQIERMKPIGTQVLYPLLKLLCSLMEVPTKACT